MATLERLRVQIIFDPTPDGMVQASAWAMVEGVRYIVQSGPMQWGGDAAELALDALMVQITPALATPAPSQEESEA